MIDGLKPYPKMRESGVPWLGEVPEHWNVQRIKTLFREKDQRSGNGEGLLLSLTRARGLLPQSEASNRIASAADLSKYKVCRVGELVMNRMQAWSGMFAASAYEGLVSPDYSVFVAAERMELRFFEHVFKTPVIVDQFAQASKGIGSGFNRLYTPDFGAIPIAFPRLPEQAAIVRFLDYADRRTRRYIRAKQKLIKLLEEQKQAIIHRAVTRGLDPNVRLKPSGVEWVGDVPEHWEVVSLKRVLRRLVDCEHKTAPAVDQSDYRVVRTSAVRNGQLRWSGTYCTSPEAFKNWTQRALPEPGDVIFTREAPAGEACLVPDSAKVCLGQRTVLMKLRREEYDAQFLVHMIYSGPPRLRIQLASQGSTVGHFNMDDIGWMKVLAPPLAEQQSIVASVTRDTASLTEAAERAEREIHLLREYRTRLIADVVTGKLDVREAAARLPQEAEDLELLDEAEVEGDAEESDAGDGDGVPEGAEA